MRFAALLSIAASLELLTGCAVHNAAPLIAADSPRVGVQRTSVFSRQFAQPKRPVWGTELAAEVSMSVPGSSGTETFDKQFCEIPRLKFSTCDYKYGLSDFKYKFSKSLGGIYGDSASAAVSGESRVGRATFSQADALVSTRQPAQSLLAWSQSFIAWVDWVTPTSRTLPKGTQVTFQATLTVKPSIVNEPCISDVDTPYFDLRAPGSDGSYGVLEVEGECEGVTPSAPGSFIFRLHNAYYGPIGTTDTGTITAGIDQAFQIQGFTYVSPGLCTKGPVCPSGNLSDELAGKTTYSIRSITPGVSFKTASGYNYP